MGITREITKLKASVTPCCVISSLGWRLVRKWRLDRFTLGLSNGCGTAASSRALK